MKNGLKLVIKIENLGEIWANEPSGFVGWITEEGNLNLLAKMIGADLALMGARADADAAGVPPKKSNSKWEITVENQIEATNGSSFGMTGGYFAGNEVAQAVWIVGRTDEGYIKTFEFLNGSDNDAIGFFRCEIKVLRIGDSPHAPQFRIIANATEWTARTNRRAAHEN